MVFWYHYGCCISRRCISETLNCRSFSEGKKDAKNPEIAHFRAVYLVTQINDTDSIWLYGLIRDISHFWVHSEVTKMPKMIPFLEFMWLVLQGNDNNSSISISGICRNIAGLILTFGSFLRIK